jgi:predicted nucleic acid-binding protein
MVYFDTSVLVAYYCPEAISGQVEKKIRKIKQPAISPLTEVELVSAISRKIREKGLSREDGNRVIGRFQSHIKNRLFRNGDEITSPSRRIDLGQICSISNHKS